MPWWRQAEEEKQLGVTLEDISVAARERRPQESGRHSKGKGGVEGEDKDSDRGEGGTG